MKTALALALACAACGADEVHEVPLYYAPLPPSRSVDVYMSERPPARPFFEVALLQLTSFGTGADADDVVDRLSDRARALGCDALAHVRVDEGHTATHGYGVCVKYLPAPAVAPPRPPPPAPATAVSPEPTDDAAATL